LQLTTHRLSSGSWLISLGISIAYLSFTGCASLFFYVYITLFTCSSKYSFLIISSSCQQIVRLILPFISKLHPYLTHTTKYGNWNPNPNPHPYLRLTTPPPPPPPQCPNRDAGLCAAFRGDVDVFRTLASQWKGIKVVSALGYLPQTIFI
jgi:hypothetical protein